MLFNKSTILFLAFLGTLFARALGSTLANYMFDIMNFPHGFYDSFPPIWSNYTLYGTVPDRFLCAALALASGHKMFKLENQVCSTSQLPWRSDYVGNGQLYYRYYRAILEPVTENCWAPYEYVAGAGCVYVADTPPLNRSDAQTFCNTLGGRLFIADNTSHFMALKAYVKERNVIALVGITTRHWDNGRLVDALEWAPGEPYGNGPSWAGLQPSMNFRLNDFPQTADVAVGYACQLTT